MQDCRLAEDFSQTARELPGLRASGRFSFLALFDTALPWGRHDVKLLRPGGSCSVSESVSKALASWGRSSPLVTNVWSLPRAAHGSDRGRNSPRCRLALPWSWPSALLLSRCTGTSADSSLSRGRTSPLSMRTTVLPLHSLLLAGSGSGEETHPFQPAGLQLQYSLSVYPSFHAGAEAAEAGV